MRTQKTFYALASLILCSGTTGCISHSTGETEVGVLVCKVGLGCKSKGVQSELYPPGSTNFFAPFIRDWYTFDTKVQNLEMIADAKRGDRPEADDLQFKTTDGNDISMDVTVAWTIDPKHAPDLLQNVGTSTADVKEKLVRPMARTLVRDILNELDSESVYNSDKRFEKAEKAKKVLSEALEPRGVLVSQVILHEHRFAPDYEKVIHDRKLAEQRAQQLKSESEAAVQEQVRNLESARGKVAADIAQAEGALEQAKLAADAEYFQQQQNSDAILAERTAKAKAIQKRNEALRGAGGRAMVKLRIAEALDGKQIVLVPGGATGVGLNKLDVNKLVDTAAAQEATASEPESK
jgi:regulator of protease activity HflC (stomatin/prohibitin superfamily)